MTEFVFVSVGRIPLGQKILADKLNERGIKTKIISLATLYEKIFDAKGEDAYKERKRVKAFQRGVDAYLKGVEGKIQGAQFFGMTFFDTIGAKETSFVISHAIKKHFPNSTLIAGGPAFNSDPTSFLKESKADYALRGEAENTLPRLIEILSKRKKGNIKNITGIMFREKGKIYSHPSSAKLTPTEIKNSKFTYIKEGRIAFTYSERGCKNACIFCTVPRKGNPMNIKTETIIQGLEQLTKNKEIQQVSFVDNHFFSNSKRANEILNEIIKRKLNKRFVFDCATTIEAFIKNGKPNTALMKKAREAGIMGMEIGVEALNDNMLKEIKGKRYTKVQAIEVLKAFKKSGIQTNNYMLAGGVHTRARDFMESYYNALRLEMKGTAFFYPMAMIGATKKTPIHRTAEKENALFTRTGRNVKPTRKGKTGFRIVVPKDEALRKLFIEKLKRGEGRQFTSSNIPNVVKMGQESNDKVMQKYARKLQKMEGEEKAIMNLLEKLSINIRTHVVAREMQKKGIKLTNPNLKKFLQNPKTREAIETLSRKTLDSYLTQSIALKKLTGVERLRAIQKLRKTTGIGTTYNFRLKKHARTTRR
ncbi:MAG: coproporphyrinogen III oxidase [archaeon ADurb.Bin336]|nr:MAG: coproporphyrinogen III oxidase [archaeon ADurb.Bin336]